MTAADYAGIIGIIGAVTAGVVSIVNAWNGRKVAQKVDEVHAAVSTSNGRTLGEIVEANDLTGPHD